MKSILITKQIEYLSLNYADHLFDTRTSRFIKPLDRLKTLRTAVKRKHSLHQDYVQYLDTLIRLYPLLNKLKPKQFQKVEDKFFAGYVGLDMSKLMKIGVKNMRFYKHISAAMRYDAVRDYEFLRYAKEMGIRACVYCNANYATSFKKNKIWIARYELDHFRPQSKYPYLSTNFYNLYPVCGNCNKAKLDRDTLFCLYTEEPKDMNPFKFTLDKGSVVKYMLSQNFEDLKINFHPNAHIDHDDVFKIEATYNALKDAVEEIIWKYKVYNPSYLKSLNESFNKKFDNGGFKRFIIGNYDRPADIHKRPLAKITQDIARQIGLLK
jgi:hypothetical protein